MQRVIQALQLLRRKIEPLQFLLDLVEKKLATARRDVTCILALPENLDGLWRNPCKGDPAAVPV